MSPYDEIVTTLNNLLNVESMFLENESGMHNVPIDSETHFKLIIVSDDFVELSSFKYHSRPVLKLVCGGCSFGQIVCLVHILYLLPQIIIDHLRFSIGYLVKEDGLLARCSSKIHTDCVTRPRPRPSVMKESF